MEYKEYQGCRGLVVADVLTDDDNGYTTGKWERLAGVQAINHGKTESSEKHFYDNLAAIIIDAVEGDEVGLVVSIPANKTRAKIEGYEYDETIDAIIKTITKKGYKAIGYIGRKDDGTEEVNILYKGKFSGGNKVLNTRDDGTTTTNMEYTYTAVHTNNKIYTNKQGEQKQAMAFECPFSDTITETAVFGTFTEDTSSLEVLTPNEIIALATA